MNVRNLRHQQRQDGLQTVWDSTSVVSRRIERYATGAPIGEVQTHTQQSCMREGRRKHENVDSLVAGLTALVWRALQPAKPRGRPQSRAGCFTACCTGSTSVACTAPARRSQAAHGPGGHGGARAFGAHTRR